MAIIFLRIDQKEGNNIITDRFLFDCTSRQESLLRRGNRKAANSNGVALFLVLLCNLLPKGETLASRKTLIQEACFMLSEDLKEQEEEVTLTSIAITNALTTTNTFFMGPYGLFKVKSSPISVLDTNTEDHRVSNIVITSDINLDLLKTL